MEEILRLIKGEVCMGTYGLVELELRKLVRVQKPPHNTGRPKLPPCKYCGDKIEADFFVKDFAFCPYCGRQLRPRWEVHGAIEAWKLVEEKFTSTTARDEICADIIENDSPCAYCTESGKGHCQECAVQTHQYFFKGRKLRPC